MLTAERLSKRYGTVTACKDVSFSLGEGEIVALAGINGAGKSTVIRLVAGIMSADAGRIVVCGHDMRDDPTGARREIGSMFEDVPLYRDMTVRSHLDFSVSAYGLRADAAKAAVDRAIRDCDLSDFADTLIDRLPKGGRQRLAIACAIAHDPAILLLDEPANGLDPVQAERFRALLRSLRGRGKSILVSTHALTDMESLCDRVIVIDSGSIAADLPTGEFRNASPSRSVERSFLDLVSKPSGVIR